MGKKYRITYRIFPNDRLKEVSFHGVATHPIYVQITYRRHNVVFKSYYFDLFFQSRHSTNKANQKQLPPTVDGIIGMERELIEYLILRSGEDTTLEGLQRDYYFYGQDLCTSSEESFRVNMFLILQENGTGAFARALAKGSQSEILYEVLQDMKVLLNVDVYGNLMAEALKLQQFYMPLYAFVLHAKSPPYLYLSIMEWERGEMKAAFAEHLQRTDSENAATILQGMERWIAYLGKHK